MKFPKILTLAIPILCLFLQPLVAEEIKDPQGMALFKKIKAAYENASSFSCEGQYLEEMQTVRPHKEIGTFKILFSHPNQIRVDWSDTVAGGEVFTNSIYTENKAIFFYWPHVGQWKQEKDMGSAIAEATGISHSISYTIPSLMRGESNPLTFTKLKPPGEIVVDGKKCLLLSGATGYKDDMELAVDLETYAIRQIKSTTLIQPKKIEEEVEKTQKELEKTDPELAAKLKNHPISTGSDFVVISTLTFKDPTFNKELKAEDFIYPVPAGTKKTK